jgi:hypothetical protein
MVCSLTEDRRACRLPTSKCRGAQAVETYHKCQHPNTCTDLERHSLSRGLILRSELRSEARAVNGGVRLDWRL